LNTYLERQTIEVAPLAFMRGRAQPVWSGVLTPDGFRPIGSLRIGDLVIGSDGFPTPVLGVYPQGRKDVFRVRTQDGASTTCCGEHLWHVFTHADRRRGKPGRVLETREMIGHLRTFHQHRFELPLLSGSVEFEPRDVPIDPYALGLLLGDGCLTTSTTPSFTTSDPELAHALEASLDRIELRHIDGHRGGVIVANPVTAALRELGPAGRRSSTKFIPAAYLRNSPDVRIAVLQGLLDTDGGPVTQKNRTCRIQYTTCSARLRDDVADLVRSLGGVVYWRVLDDAFVMDIRLPSAIEPFRLRRKRETYNEHGGGRPMRFIDSIEPAGEEETVCIQVAAADSLYVTEHYLLTHNTLNDSFIILDEAQNT
ncbi:MAG: LAGLIDADG family homing endonuclease, partial [Gaiellaceae bacterium]